MQNGRYLKLNCSFFDPLEDEYTVDSLNSDPLNSHSSRFSHNIKGDHSAKTL